MSGNLRGKRVLLIGGEAALGRPLVVALGEAGAAVTIASASATTAAEFAINSILNQLWAMGRQGLALVVDASDAAQVRDAVARAERDLGRLHLAAVLAPDDGAGLALDALRNAIAPRPVVVLAPQTPAEEAMAVLLGQLS